MMKCWKCKRKREDRYIKVTTNENGKKSFRCRKRSVCASIGRRNKLGRGPNSAR